MNSDNARSLRYAVLCACERWGIRPREFDAMEYADQMELLAWDQLRQAERQEP